MPKILAFGHQKYTGKDTLVRFCIDILRPQLSKQRLIRRGFADKLYDFCYLTYGWAGFKPRQHYVDHPYAKGDILSTGKTVRDTLIEVGNHLRSYDSDIWINACLRTTDFDTLFITDLRFPNEFLHCESVNATLIRVVRPGLPEPTDAADTALNGWEERWHDTVVNDGGLDKLHKEAERIINTYILNV